MNYVWVSFQESSSYEGWDVISVSSTEEKARQICQDKENKWGEGKSQTPLKWGKDLPGKAEGYVDYYYVQKVEIDKEVEQ